MNMYGTEFMYVLYFLELNKARNAYKKKFVGLSMRVNSNE